MKSLLNGVLSALLLIGCGVDLDARVYVEDSDLDLYVTKFKMDAKAHGVVLPETYLMVKLATTVGPGYEKRIGYCSYGSPRTVVIDKDWWVHNPPENRMWLVYHELGHCWLLRQHDHRCRVSNGVECIAPESVMYPYLLLDAFRQNEEYYIQELFNGYVPR